jgi:CDP-diacylglycerol---glycerol-3-phosphate 3-phosphatidyltransferase
VLDKKFRTDYEKKIAPIGAGLGRIGVTADVLTVLGLLLAVASAVVIANGWLRAGFVLVVLAAVPDLLDGAVAKAGKTASPRGAFFDSTVDRITDFIFFGGIAWYLTAEHGGQWAMLPFALAGASALISYERAKAEALGYNAKGGLMERAERIVLLCVGLVLNEILIPILFVMLALTLVTAVQRFVSVWKQASADRPTPPERPHLRRESRFIQQYDERVAARRAARAERVAARRSDG